MKSVANMLLANAPFAPGPRLLPLTMLAPVRRPLATPITVATSFAQTAARQQGQPTWVSAFLDRALEETPTAECTADLHLLAPR